jgi:hypothetical protein
MSIVSEISRLQSDSSAIASAIEAKGVTVPSGSGYDDYASLIASIPTGGGSEFDDWVDDENTHLWININTDYLLYQVVRLKMTGTIDWGDGTTQSISPTAATSYEHTYAQCGRYRIDLIPSSSSAYTLGSASTSYCVMGSRTNANSGRLSCLYQAQIGTKGITALSNYTFYYCYGLRRVYVPKNIVTMGSGVFYMNYSLKEVIFEDDSKVTSTGAASLFYYCYSLTTVHGYNPTKVTALSATYRNCYSIKEVVIPKTVTSIAANTFGNNHSLKKMICLPTAPPTVAAESAFTALPSGCEIRVPYSADHSILNNYKAAQYWSTYASQMVEAPA